MSDLSDVKRIFDIPPYQLGKYNLGTALAHRVTGTWESISSAEYVEKINTAARGLLRLGVKKGDKIGLVSANRMEWCILDQAVMKIGAVTVPVYPTVSQDDYLYIFNHSEIRFCFVADGFLYNKLSRIKNGMPHLEAIYSFDKAEGTVSWDTVLEKGRDMSAQEEVEAIASTILPDDVATLIYTSGTTGTPKGVLLSHDNILSNVKIALPRVQEIEGTRALSFLPLCHIYERTVNLAYQTLGCGVYFAKSTETIAADAMDAKPVIMMVVPRVVEKIYTKIVSKAEVLSGFKKAVFSWAVNLGMKYEPYHNTWFYRMRLAVARRLVFNKWKQAMGGHLRIMISGSSSLDAKLSRLFCAAGIILNEGYGLTETSPIISTNIYPNRGLRIGSIGRPFENLDVRIADDGEILVKGPSVMKGYYKDPERTAAAFDKDGYFMTGDIGHLSDGFLYITDRKKEMFKTSGGKYITPQPMENKLMQSRFIEQAMVVGDGRKHPAVIIEPDLEELKEWCGENGVLYTDAVTVLSDHRVNAMYRKIINEVNRTLGNWEKIRHFRLVPDRWSIEGGELTPTLKVKRRRLLDKYTALIDSIYEEENGAG